MYAVNGLRLVPSLPTHSRAAAALRPFRSGRAREVAQQDRALLADDRSLVREEAEQHRQQLQRQANLLSLQLVPPAQQRASFQRPGTSWTSIALAETWEVIVLFTVASRTCCSRGRVLWG